MKRLKPAQRKAEILAAAIPLAERVGYSNITRAAVSEACGLKGPTVQYHFGDISRLKAAVVAYAVQHENLRILAQALVAGDPQVSDLSQELRRKALLAV